jgi:hypothetical protein
VKVVSDKGGKFGFVYRSVQNVYRALRRKGYSKEKSARIANSKVHGGGGRKVGGKKLSNRLRGRR